VTLGQRSRNLFIPGAEKPYELSRSKLEDFTRCRRCFYLDRRLGIGRPSTPPYTLNSAVDHLLKKEFDVYRAKAEPHPLMKKYNIDAVPFAHPDLAEWRDNFKGVRITHAPTGLTLYGAIDDLWIRPGGELIVVDYKSTSKDGEITLEDEWKAAYKRQMEIYQWLLRQKGFPVSNTGYFVYANARKDPEGFGESLLFSVTVIPYEGNADWVEPLVLQIRDCLHSEAVPDPDPECEYCAYRLAARGVE
jgi:RecB family exonuclease